MLSTLCYIYDVTSEGDGVYRFALGFSAGGHAQFIKPNDILIDSKKDKYKILTWDSYPNNFTTDGFVTAHYVTNDVLPQATVDSDDCLIYTEGELDIRTHLTTAGSIGEVSVHNSRQSLFKLSADWIQTNEGNKAIIGDYISDGRGKLYKIIEFGTSKWIDFIVEEVDKENLLPFTGEAYLFRPTENFDLYFGGKLNDNQLMKLMNRDNFLIDYYTSIGGKGGAGIFILDVVPTSSGIIGMKTYVEDTTPQNINLKTALSDTTNIRVIVGMNGDGDSYSPIATVNGTNVVLSESDTTRWFVGYADVNIIPGDNFILAESSTGSKDNAWVQLAGAGPNVLNVTFGAYPGSQTELKENDTIGINISTETSATEVKVLVGGANKSELILPVSGGVASGTITISNLNGNHGVQVVAKNQLGTEGEIYSSTTLVLNQTVPTITSIGITYPEGQFAFNETQSGTLTSTVTNFDTISYTSSQFNITDPTVYNSTKTITNIHTGYVGTGNNVTITANRAANNTTTVRNGLAKIATVPATAVITIAGNPAKLRSSALGVDYTVIVTPNQELQQAPELDVTIGSWQGDWSFVSNTWRRNLRIVDTDPKGTGYFNNLEMVGLSGILGTEITSGNSYEVGGFVSRTITFPAFSRVAPIGTPVVDQTKTTAQISGGNVLVRYTDNDVRENGYYIANEDGSYNPTGMYLGLSDSAFAGANTTGTLQAIVQEEV